MNEGCCEESYRLYPPAPTPSLCFTLLSTYPVHYQTQHTSDSEDGIILFFHPPLKQCPKMSSNFTEQPFLLRCHPQTAGQRNFIPPSVIPSLCGNCPSRGSRGTLAAVIFTRTSLQPFSSAANQVNRHASIDHLPVTPPQSSPPSQNTNIGAISTSRSPRAYLAGAEKEEDRFLASRPCSEIVMLSRTYHDSRQRGGDQIET